LIYRLDFLSKALSTHRQKMEYVFSEVITLSKVHCVGTMSRNGLLGIHQDTVTTTFALVMFVVLAMDRPWVKAGLKRAQISSDDLPCLLVQRTARMRGNGSLNNRFLIYLVSSDAFTYHILGMQTGSGVPHISSKQIKDFQFFKPPVKEQVRIANLLDKLSTETKRLKSLYRHKLAAFDELKKSLLHQAFTGNL